MSIFAAICRFLNRQWLARSSPAESYFVSHHHLRGRSRSCSLINQAKTAPRLRETGSTKYASTGLGLSNISNVPMIVPFMIRNAHQRSHKG
jgi:hypothetical protein